MPKNTRAVIDAACSFTAIGEDILVQRFDGGARFSQELLRTVGRERDRLCGSGGRALLVVIPRSVPVNAEMTNTDHFRDQRSARRIRALAIVAEEGTMRSVCKFYFKWFPQPFVVEVFEEYDPAMQWLLKRVGNPD